MIDHSDGSAHRYTCPATANPDKQVRVDINILVLLVQVHSTNASYLHTRLAHLHHFPELLPLPLWTVALARSTVHTKHI